jgi:hypothetical protein
MRNSHYYDQLMRRGLEQTVLIILLGNGRGLPHLCPLIDAPIRIGWRVWRAGSWEGGGSITGELLILYRVVLSENEHRG